MLHQLKSYVVSKHEDDYMMKSTRTTKDSRINPQSG